MRDRVLSVCIHIHVYGCICIYMYACKWYLRIYVRRMKIWYVCVYKSQKVTLTKQMKELQKSLELVVSFEFCLLMLGTLKRYLLPEHQKSIWKKITVSSDRDMKSFGSKEFLECSRMLKISRRSEIFVDKSHVLYVGDKEWQKETGHGMGRQKIFTLLASMGRMSSFTFMQD